MKWIFAIQCSSPWPGGRNRSGWCRRRARRRASTGVIIRGLGTFYSRVNYSGNPELCPVLRTGGWNLRVSGSGHARAVAARCFQGVGVVESSRLVSRLRVVGRVGLLAAAWGWVLCGADPVARADTSGARMGSSSAAMRGGDTARSDSVGPPRASGAAVHPRGSGAVGRAWPRIRCCPEWLRARRGLRSGRCASQAGPGAVSGLDACVGGQVRAVAPGVGRCRGGCRDGAGGTDRRRAPGGGHRRGAPPRWSVGRCRAVESGGGFHSDLHRGWDGVESQRWLAVWERLQLDGGVVHRDGSVHGRQWWGDRIRRFGL